MGLRYLHILSPVDGLSNQRFLGYALLSCGRVGQCVSGLKEHPHRGFEMVTIIHQGELGHGSALVTSAAADKASHIPGGFRWNASV